MKLEDLNDFILGLPERADVTVNVNLWLDEDGDDPVDPDPPPDPDPVPNYRLYKVTADKTLARYQVGENAQGKPILDIFGDVASARIRYNLDQSLMATVDKIDVDGTKDVVKLKTGTNGAVVVPYTPALYIFRDDLTVV